MTKREEVEYDSAYDSIGRHFNGKICCMHHYIEFRSIVLLSCGMLSRDCGVIVECVVVMRELH